jgi:hypothetical protein
MLRNNKDRICAFFAADYDLRLGTRLSAAADAICESREPERAGVGANSFYDFQWPTARGRLLLGPKRTAIETMGRSLIRQLSDAEQFSEREYEGNSCEMLRQLRDTFLNLG